jgi:hypothetical protein
MNNMTYIQHLELIDIAANENRLWHHNGGQAYIQVSHESNVLMIIDQTNVDHPTLELRDGTQYFETYKGYNWEHSRRLREHGSLAEWFKNTWPELVGA